jgi:hypothetical protein
MLCYSYPFKIIRSIAIAFEESGQLVLKLRGGVWYPILQNEHIQQLMEHPNAHSIPHWNLSIIS